MIPLMFLIIFFIICPNIHFQIFTMKIFFFCCLPEDIRLNYVYVVHLKTKKKKGEIG